MFGRSVDLPSVARLREPVGRKLNGHFAHQSWNNECKGQDIASAPSVKPTHQNYLPMCLESDASLAFAMMLFRSVPGTDNCFVQKCFAVRCNEIMKLDGSPIGARRADRGAASAAHHHPWCQCDRTVGRRSGCGHCALSRHCWRHESQRHSALVCVTTSFVL